MQNIKPTVSYAITLCVLFGILVASKAEVTPPKSVSRLPSVASITEDPPEAGFGGRSFRSPVYVPKDEVDFSNICNKPLLENLDDWYEGWLAKYYLHKPFANMLLTSSSHLNEVDAHIATVEKYLMQLKAYQTQNRGYTFYFMKDKMYRLLAGFSDDLGLPFDLAQKMGSDGALKDSKFGQTLQETEADAHSIHKVSKVFYDDLKLVHGEQKERDELQVHPVLKDSVGGYVTEVEVISQHMCGVLSEVVGLFAGRPDMESVWKRLEANEGKINTLADFFTNFRYVLGEFRPKICGDGHHPNSLRGLISFAALGLDLDKDLKTTFFSAYVFDVVGEATGYADIVAYDRLLLLPTNDHIDLPMIQEVLQNKPAFSIEFFNDFPSLNVENALEDEKAGMHDLHTASVHLLLYRLYILLRSGDFGLIKKTMSLTEIYSEIFKWITTTSYFQQDVLPSSQLSEIVLTESELSVKTLQTHKKSSSNNDLIPVGEYTIYYPVLVTLLAKKLGLDIPKQAEQVRKPIKDLPILYRPAALHFPDDSIHPEIVKMIDENVQKNRLATFGTSLLSLKFDDALKACYRPVPGGKTGETEFVLTFDCAKPFYLEFSKLFNEYLSKIGDKDDVGGYITAIETSIETLDSRPKQELLDYCILLYFQILSKKDTKDIKGYEYRMAERFLMRAITLMTASLTIERVRGFTTFMIGASDYKAFGKHFKFIDSAEGEFHAYNIFYIVLFAQLNEAKRLKLAGKTDEFKQVMAYKGELQKVFETRYPGVVKLIAEDSKKRPLRFIKSIYKTEFFLSFLDFFDFFYVNLEDKLHRVNSLFRSEFVSLHTVFVNFYHFLYSIRETVHSRLEMPHQYLLEKLEGCLAYASRPTSAPAVPELEAECTFSDRKYSEMYYFYKFYLILSQRAQADLRYFREDRLITHTRMFFIYAVNQKWFAQLLESTCAQEQHQWVDICVSWVLFNDFYKLILDSTHRGSSFGFVKQFIAQRILPNPNTASARHVKFNILFAAEAISLLVDGKGVNYSRFIALFNLDEQYALLHTANEAIGEEDQRVLALFHIKQGDSENRELMVQYLKRTYFKKSRTSNEQAITRAIVSVLDESAGGKDLLPMYFTYADHVLVNYVKLFLMYATRDEHYAKIADFLIVHGVFFELANLNRPEDDLAYKSIVEKLALNDQNYLWEKKNGKPTAQFPHDLALYRDVLFKSLSKRYKKILETTSVKLMAMAQVDGEQNVERTDQDFDIFSEFMEMGRQDVRTNVQVEVQRFVTVNKELSVARANSQSGLSMSQIKIVEPDKDEPKSPSGSLPAKTGTGSGMSAETLAQMPMDATKLLERLETLEDKQIKEEAVDPQNFGFSEKVIIEDQAEKLSKRFSVDQGYFDPDLKTPTVMESLLTLQENVQRSPSFLESTAEDAEGLSDPNNKSPKSIAESHTSIAPAEKNARARRRRMRTASMRRVRI